MASKGAPDSAGASQHPVTIVENKPQTTVAAALASGKAQADKAAKK
jgi:hypothetical protein